MHYATVHMDFYFKISMGFTYAKKYYTLMCFHHFTLKVKDEKKPSFLMYHFIVLTWSQGRKKIPINLRGQFATLEINVAIIKYNTYLINLGLYKSSKMPTHKFQC
jgi:hypothetical protein